MAFVLKGVATRAKALFPRVVDFTRGVRIAVDLMKKAISVIIMHFNRLLEPKFGMRLEYICLVRDGPKFRGAREMNY